MKTFFLAISIASVALWGCDANNTSKQGTYETSRLPQSDKSIDDTVPASEKGAADSSAAETNESDATSTTSAAAPAP